MTRLFSIKPAITFRGRRFHGIRGWAGKPSHPPLTDFPIVCYLVAAFCDVVSYVAGRSAPTGQVDAVAHDFFSAGTIVIVLGAVVSLGTALTGFWDWWKSMPRRKAGLLGKAQHTQVWRTANWHMTVMLTVTAIVIVDIVVRWVQFDDAMAGLGVTILSVLAAILVTLGAAYGGSLVFEYQFNVESLKGSTAWDETEVDQLPGQKAPPPAS
jgi:uncharacterized membrane protein